MHDLPQECTLQNGACAFASAVKNAANAAMIKIFIFCPFVNLAPVFPGCHCYVATSAKLASIARLADYSALPGRRPVAFCRICQAVINK
jgi:hypothetical protein